MYSHDSNVPQRGGYTGLRNNSSSEGKFFDGGRLNSPGQFADSSQPFLGYHGPTYNQPFLPPPVYAPPFMNMGYPPAPNYPQEFNPNPANNFPPSIEGNRNLPPPSPSPQLNLSLLNQGCSGFSLQSKSVAGWCNSKLFRKFPSRQHSCLKFEIHDYRIRLEKYVVNVRKLDELTRILKDELENLSDVKWEEISNQMKTLKKNIQDEAKYLTDAEVLSTIKVQLKKRAKKRARLQRRNADYHEQKVKEENNRKILNQKIDDWLTSEQEKAAAFKRDELLKKEAQMVLSEVTRRTTEANRQLDLLSGLEKLRLIKSQTPQSNTDSKPFDSFIVFDNLKKMWQAKLKEYELEEQGLRVMLSEANLETIKSNKSLEKEALLKWTQLLFGKESSHQFYTDFSELLLIRNQWDKFVAPHNSGVVNVEGVSSFIPIGWVLPSAPSSDAWRKLLVDE